MTRGDGSSTGETISGASRNSSSGETQGQSVGRELLIPTSQLSEVVPGLVQAGLSALTGGVQRGESQEAGTRIKASVRRGGTGRGAGEGEASEARFSETVGEDMFGRMGNSAQFVPLLILSE